MSEADARLAVYAHEATKMIIGLTPGGSEYFGPVIAGIYTADLDVCRGHIVDARAAQSRRLTERLAQTSMERAKLAARVHELEGALRKIRDGHIYCGRCGSHRGPYEDRECDCDPGDASWVLAQSDPMDIARAALAKAGGTDA